MKKFHDKDSITNGRILLVDDEPISIESLCFLLKSDYEIHLAQSGEEAIRIAEENPPDLILLDIVMPKMDGFEVFRRIQMNPELSDIPVLFITALSEAECERKGLELGAHDYLTKPYNASIVRLRVKNHIVFKQRNDLVKIQRDQLVRKNIELENALARVSKLEGIITICMHCKQVRSSPNSWEQLDKYIMENSDAKFSHGICPECLQNFYPDL